MNRFSALLIHLGLLLALLGVCRASAGDSVAPGNEACAGCHQKIYDSYKTTAMAKASGPAKDGLIEGDFLHKRSGVKYGVHEEDGKVWLDYARPSEPGFVGKRELLYFIGSGRRGRSYLFSDDGFLFESPVNWYAQKKMWDMAPAYQDASSIPMNLPAVPECLNCHTSGMRTPMAGTENRYYPPAFAHGGITCERCHSNGQGHPDRSAAIVNPVKLPAARRDEICMQCHLEGNVAIERPGKHLSDFQPGDTLGDYVRYFVLEDKSAQGIRALSQVEAMSQSVCKLKTGDKMSCMSCHDPHYWPRTEERASYYRAKCLGCHNPTFAAKHHADKPDCTGCHMPFVASTNVAHTQATDHRILRLPASGPQFETLGERASSPRLLPFPDTPDNERDIRDLALAWESLASGGMQAAVPQADRFLSQAVKHSPADPAVLAAYGYIEQRRGANEQAREYYERALKIDPNLIEAATDLGVLEAQSGNLSQAVKLWRNAFEHAPGRSAIGMNIAFAYCAAAKYEEAKRIVERVLEFNPDLPSAKQLRKSLSAAAPSCER